MNTEMEYKILFTGQFRSDISRDEIKKNVSTLFKIDNPDKISHFFSEKSFIIKKTTCEKKAQQYQTTLYKAGLLCDIIVPTDSLITNNPSTPPEKPDWSELTLSPIKRSNEPEVSHSLAPEKIAELKAKFKPAETTTPIVNTSKDSTYSPPEYKETSPIKGKIILIAVIVASVLFIKKFIIDERPQYGKTMIGSYTLPADFVSAVNTVPAQMHREDGELVVSGNKSQFYTVAKFQLKNTEGPYRIVLIINGHAIAAGKSVSAWQPAWAFEDGGAIPQVLTPLIKRDVKAGEKLTLESASMPLRFKEDFERLLILENFSNENIKIEKISVQVWKGVAPLSNMSILFAFTGLLTSLIYAFLRRR